MQQRQVSRGHRHHLPRHQLCHPTTQDNWKSQCKLDTINCNTQYLQREHDINLQQSFHHLIIIPTPTITEINWTHASPSLLLFWLGWTLARLPNNLLSRLQSVTNSAAQSTGGLRCSDHLTDTLASFQWLRASQRIKFTNISAKTESIFISTILTRHYFVTVSIICHSGSCSFLLINVISGCTAIYAWGGCQHNICN